MAVPESKSDRNSVGMLDAGKAAWLKVIAGSLKRRKPEPIGADTVFNAFTQGDPVNQILEGDIIPRLMLAHAVGASFGPFEEGEDIDPTDTERFADMPLRLEAPNLLEEVERFLEQGVSVEDVYLDLLAPAARRLGEMWSNDECDFVDVTMGLWRLQEVMRELSLRNPPRITGLADQRSVLLCPIPGETHSFGAQMLEEVFARAGWQSEILLQPERRELLDHVSRRPFDVIGLTVSRDCPAAALSSLVKAIRSVSKNSSVSVIVGGHMINQNPGIVTEIGADGTGVDAREALETAEMLVSRAPVRAHTMI